MSTLCDMVKEAHHWTPEEKNKMRRLFEHIIRVWPNLMVCIRETQGQLVHNAEQRGKYNWRVIAEFDLELVRLTEAGQLDQAVSMIAEKLKSSVEEFWPDCPLPSYQDFLKQRLERQSGSSTPATDQATTL